MSTMNYDPSKKFLDSIEHQLDMLMEEDDNSAKQPESFLSSDQMSEHYDKHYKGYLDGYKKAKRTLDSTSKTDKAEYRGALLDLSFNYNAIVLHENYFESLGKSDPSSSTKKLIEESFGSVEALNESLINAAETTSGWVILGYNQLDKDLNIVIVDDHDVHCSLMMPMLALDVWEHSYYIDFKSDKEKYIKALVDDINWDAVSRRIDKVK